MSIAGNYWLKGVVGPQTLADGTESFQRFGRSGELITAKVKGTFAEQVQRNNVFSASAAAVTIPVIDAAMVSVFSIFNPIGSGKLLEIIDTEIQNVLAATVVNLYGWYYSGPALAGLHTLTTLGVVQSRRIGDGTAAAGKFYSALTHFGTPILAAAIGGTGATTNGATRPLFKNFNGALIVPPGVAISVAGSTAAGTTVGNTISASWAEHPL